MSALVGEMEFKPQPWRSVDGEPASRLEDGAGGRVVWMRKAMGDGSSGGYVGNGQSASLGSPWSP